MKGYRYGAVKMVKSPYLTGSIIESAVGLLLVKAGDRANATTVSFFSEVAHHPTTLWVSVAKSTYSKELIDESGEFSLAILNQSQRNVAESCGMVSGRDQDKFSSLDLYSSPKGFLFLRDALASTGCRVRQSVDLDDYTLFVADIIEAHLDSRRAHLRHLLLSDLRH